MIYMHFIFVANTQLHIFSYKYIPFFDSRGGGIFKTKFSSSMLLSNNVTKLKELMLVGRRKTLSLSAPPSHTLIRPSVF